MFWWRHHALAWLLLSARFTYRTFFPFFSLLGLSFSHSTSLSVSVYFSFLLSLFYCIISPSPCQPLCHSLSVWPDWAIYLTLGNFLKPLATINLSKSPTFLGNFCMCLKIYYFSSESILGNFYRHLAIFFWSHCSSVMSCCMLTLQYLHTKRTLTGEGSIGVRLVSSFTKLDSTASQHTITACFLFGQIQSC